jgi:hypothetical protein
MSRDISRSPAVIPARHHSETVSPRSDGVMCSTTGSRPPLVCTQACRQSVAARRGVMTHQALAMRRWRDGYTIAAVSRASPVAAVAISQVGLPSRHVWSARGWVW